MTALALFNAVAVGILTGNPLAGFGAFLGTIFLAIWLEDHLDDILV